jgi:hypothetical protein
MSEGLLSGAITPNVFAAMFAAAAGMGTPPLQQQQGSSQQSLGMGSPQLLPFAAAVSPPPQQQQQGSQPSSGTSTAATALARGGMRGRGRPKARGGRGGKT